MKSTVREAGLHLIRQTLGFPSRDEHAEFMSQSVPPSPRGIPVWYALLGKIVISRETSTAGNSIQSYINQDRRRDFEPPKRTLARARAIIIIN